MSVNARTTVSTSPASMRWRSPSMVEVAVVACAHVVSFVRSVGGVGRGVSRAGRAAARPCRRSGPPSPCGRGRGARRAMARQIRRCCRCEWPMLGSSAGIAPSIESQGGLHRRHRLLQPRRAGQRGDREVEAGVGLAVRALARRPRARRASVEREPVAIGLGEVVAGGEVRGAGLDDAAELQRVEPVGLRRRGDPGEPAGEAAAGLRASRRSRRRGRAWSRPARPRRRAAIASRSVARLTASRSASSRSGGSRLPDGVDPEPDRGRELLHAALERVVPAHRPEHRAGEVLVRLGGHAGQSVQVRR